MNRWIFWCAWLAGSASVCAQGTTGLSERDFLTDVPLVLSVSRLPQRLDDTPGAVTVLDREFIRLSGARDVADLLRLVPGFQSSMSFESIAPQASYHGGFSSYSNRIQVLVDGRSTYSAYFIGSVEPGLQSVAMDDIERIEVLRGSNSAAYGARAFLGVINIVTRDPVDIQGTQLSLNAGNNAIGDARASMGWSAEKASFRLAVDRRSDAGLAGSNGANRIDRFNFRADLRPASGDELQLRLGTLAIDAGKGDPSQLDNLARDTRYESSYLQLDWRRSLDQDQDLALSYSHGHETYRDAFPYSLQAFGINDSIAIDASGVSRSDTLSLQHTWRAGSRLRMVWGAEFRREQVISRPVYNTDDALTTNFSRLFGNLEWRPEKNLVLNAGAMAESSSTSGSSLAPRLMLNWHLADGQTLRVGASRAYRPPSTYEQFADVRYIWNGHLLEVSTLSSGKVQPESVFSREVGYLGILPQLALNLDVRAFHERIDGFITQLNTTRPKDYANTENFSIHGLEYQLKWQPWSGTRFMFNQAYLNFSLIDRGIENGLAVDYGNALPAPKLASTLTWFQKLPGNLDLSIMHQDSGTMTPQRTGHDHQAAMTRTDLRLAAPLRLGAQRGELAVVVQNLGLPYMDADPAYAFQRRAFVTVRLNQ
ncbi:MAG: TonB-dependent receptor [Comamonadaceae bacterium]